MTFDRNQFYQDWEQHIEKVYADFKRHTEIFNYDLDIRVSQEHAKEYAQIAIKHIFLLNGGALVALPALIAAFDLSKTAGVWNSGLSFALGLVFIVFTSLFAYWSAGCAVTQTAAAKFKNYTSYFLQNMEPILSQQTIAEQKETEKKYTKAEKSGRKLAFFWEIMAVVSGILSISAFIYGARTMTIEVWNLKTPTPIVSQKN